MKDTISNKITINEKYLTLGYNLNSEDIYIHNRNYCINCNSVNGKINLEDLILSNELILPSTGIFLFGIKAKGDNSFTDINYDADKARETICSNFKVVSSKHKYLLNIYSNSDNILTLEITRIYSEGCDVEFHNIYMENNMLNISVDDLSSSCINEAGIILFNKDCDMIPVICARTEGNTANFKIDLNTVILNKNTTFYGNLILNGCIHQINIPKTSFIRSIVSNKGIFNNITVKSENQKLSIGVNNNIYFNPYITDTYFDNNNFIISGNLNSNLDLLNKELFTLSFRLEGTNEDLFFNIEHNNNLFKVVISSEQLSALKNFLTSKLRPQLLLTSSDKTINESYQLLSNYTKGSIKGDCLKGIDIVNYKPLSLTKYIEDPTNNTTTIQITEDEKSIKINVSNLVTIKEISYIRARKNCLDIKFKTLENIEKYSFDLHIGNNDTMVQANTIKKIGKKTMLCKFEKHKKLAGSNIFEFIDSLLNDGLTIKTIIDSRTYTQYIQDINEMAVYRTTKDFVSNTKKYKTLCKRIYKKLFLKLPTSKKRVLFESFLGRNVSGHPKYIYEYMVANKLDEEFELIWVLNDTDEIIEGKHKTVKRKSLKYYYLMATSGYWIFNSRQTNEIVKPKGTKYIQTWHGTPIKRLAGDMETVNMGKTVNIDSYKKAFFKESSNWDYLLVQNDFSQETLARAFNFNKEILRGYPANDILYTKNNSESIEQLKNKLNLPKDKKVILYAPTWRDNAFFQKGHYKFNIQLELDAMQKALGDEYVVALRTHYLIANKINTEKYNGFVYDFSKGFDIQELYLVSDILITDYSSVMFDYANLKRPMIFFTYDLDEYRDQLRGFYFDLEEIAPGPIALTTDAVIKSIQAIEDVKGYYKDKYEVFYNKFCHIDNGTAAKNIVETIFTENKISGGNTTNDTSSTH